MQEGEISASTAIRADDENLTWARQVPFVLVRQCADELGSHEIQRIDDRNGLTGVHQELARLREGNKGTVGEISSCSRPKHQTMRGIRRA